jgi:hypothetical protein
MNFLSGILALLIVSYLLAISTCLFLSGGMLGTRGIVGLAGRLITPLFEGF